MHVTRSRFSILAVAACLLFAAASALPAKSIDFPDETPALTFELPAGWSTKRIDNSSHALYCTPDGAANVNLQWYSVDTTELEGDLSNFAKMALKAGGIDTIDIKKTGEDTVGEDITAKFVRSEFKSPDGTAYTSTMISFPLSASRTCVVHFFLPTKSFETRAPEVKKILATIKMAK